MYMRSTQEAETMGIGQAAAVSGLSPDTLRYYERESLIGPIRRSSNGQRQYSAGDITWIGVVTCLREAGLGIGDLQQFTRLLREASDTTTRVEFLLARRSDLMQRVQQLQAAIEVLDDKIRYYAAADPPALHGGSELPA
jgi:DNA-binding transcriptional MerR regulator